jgi:hypothetical protein
MTLLLVIHKQGKLMILKVMHIFRLPGRKHDAPNMFEFVTGRGDKYNEVHVHIKRFSSFEVPTDPNELKIWLHNRFVQKDELMESNFSVFL